MKKYYAVKTGNIPGIYDNWEECKKQVSGFPNAKFKSFATKEDAENYLNDNDKNTTSLDSEYIAFVDGSYDAKTQRYSCGYVILKNNEVVFEGNAVGTNNNAATMRNVAGELLGAKKAINYALANDIKKIIICHDYAGIACWANKEWKAKNAWTQEYERYVNEAREKCDIVFRKVKGHSNDKYNDMVDLLAKKALEIE